MSTSVEDLLCRLIAIPSINPMGRDLSGPEYLEGRMADALEAWFIELGVPVERHEVAPGRFNLLARYEAPDSQMTVMLDAHMDTVPVEGMTVDPFVARHDNGRITGRGSCDVKGGMAAMLVAFERLVKERPEDSANVVMSCSCDEEATTLGILALVKLWQSGQSRLLPRAPDMAIIAEPTVLDVVVAHRGVLRFKITTRGVACHSSEPSHGVNAIYRMARVVSLLEEYASTLKQTIPSHPLCGGATLSVGRITGGVSVNIVPEECSIEIDRRLVPGETFEGAGQAIKDYLTSRVDFPLEFGAPWIECPPLSDADNGPLSSKLLAFVEQVAGPRQKIGVPFGTHAAYTCGAGIPSVVFGPGSIAQAHTKDEYIDVEPLKQAAEVYYRFCATADSL